MTVRKHFKQLVRERMEKTGESYSTARRHLLQNNVTNNNNSSTQYHLPGNIPATTALRVLLSAAGVKAPHTNKPYSEAMLFGIAGGIGIGVAAFRYEKEDFSSFFLAGRHLWYDDETYLKNALQRFGLSATIKESSGAKTAEKALREILAHGPCIAWVDMAHLPHRALPAMMSGGGYHVVTVYGIDNETGTALLGDLTENPVSISLADLATARGRIKKQAHRLLSIENGTATTDLAALVREGLSACHKAMTAKPGKGPLAMSSLDSLERWAERLSGSKDKESWEKMFPPGANLWRALTGLYTWIELYGTGGGLCRSMMADFLTEAATALRDKRHQTLAEQYSLLGRAWTSLAETALPVGVPLMRQAKELQIHYAELLTGNGPVEDMKDVWVELDELTAQAKDCFPLSVKQCGDLRGELQQRVRQIIAEERAALSTVRDLL